MLNITKRFGEVTVLNRVGIEVGKGEMLGLVGENGAGKSTLMKILSGAWAAGTFDGEILVDGKPVRFSNPRDAEHAGIAMIYQEARLIPDLSVTENVLLGHLPHGAFGLVDWAKAHSDTAALLARLESRIDPRTITRNLSSSQQQFVAIAKALARDSRVLVLDEPTATLTDGEAQTLFRVLKHLCAEGTALIYISHRLEEVIDMADRVVVLRDGELVATRDNDDRLGAEELVRLMVGRSLADVYRKREATLGPIALTVKSLSLADPAIPGRKALDDVNLSVRRGEILGLAGLVGAGRTEVLTSIFGLHGNRAEVSIEIDGAPIRIRSPRDARQHKMALLTENRRVDGLVMPFPVRQNITLANLARISSHSWLRFGRERDLSMEQVNALNIRPPNIEVAAQNLSGGNQQKVILAKWLLRDLRILLLDEPTQGIDVGAKVEIYRLMERLTEAGLAIIWVSSELPELLAMSDRIVVLAGGRVRGELDRAEATPERVMSLATDFTAVAH
jgi:ABC-type sugar transport system ATPase subunit